MGTLVITAEPKQRNKKQDPVTMVQSEAGIPSEDRQANQLVAYCKTNSYRFDCTDLRKKLGPLTVAKVKAWWAQQNTGKESSKVKAFCSIHPGHPTCAQTAKAGSM